MKTGNRLAASYQSYCSSSIKNTNIALISGDLFFIKSQLQKIRVFPKKYCRHENKIYQRLFSGNSQRKCVRTKSHSEG